ncbi:MAG: nodulation protein NfeD [Lysinibacillus sp.]
MKKIKIFTYLLLLVVAVALTLPQTAVFAKDRVYHVPLENVVEKGLYAFLERSFEEAKEQQAAAIILDINTPGGLVESAADIGMLLDNSEIPVIAYVNPSAHSAGAFIALHADEIYMHPTGTIGSAGVIDSAGNAAEEKAQSAWIAQMIAAAKSSDHDRDPKYAEAMANPNMDFDEFRYGSETKFLTLTAQEAVKVGYAEGIAENLAEVYKLAGLKDVEEIEMEPTLAENIARIVTNPVVVPVLLSIASLGLVLELYSPGFGLPGTMSLTAFGLFFFGHMIAGFAGYETFIIFVIGLALLILELFVPGGIVGIIGGALIIVSLLFAGESVTHMAYSIIIAMFIALIGMVIIMKFFGKKLHVFNKLVLRDATTTEEGYVSNENRLDLIGKSGLAHTAMRPAGVIVVDNERIDAVSEGSFIDKGKTIVVIKVEGSRIVVREQKN